jgi:peptide/nickel transport system permease protein
MLVVAILCALFGSWIYPTAYDRSTGPPLQRPNQDHPLGTDDLGFDILAQLLLGGRISITVGLGVGVSATLIGSLIGFSAGFYGGWIDQLLMRLVDITFGIPQFLVMIVLAAWLGPSLNHTIGVLILFSWMMPARLIRSSTARLKEEWFVKAARSYGAGPLYVFFRHLLPQLAPLMGLSLIRTTSRAIMAEAGMAFLGLGDPSLPSWGQIMRNALAFPAIWHTDFWRWWLLSPQLAITWVAIALALLYRSIDALYGTEVATSEQKPNKRHTTERREAEGCYLQRNSGSGIVR